MRYAAVKSVSITWIWIHSGVVSEYADLRLVRLGGCKRLRINIFDKAAAVNSDAQLYKQAGNSVTVSVVYAIALKIKEIAESEREKNEV